MYVSRQLLSIQNKCNFNLQKNLVSLLVRVFNTQDRDTNVTSVFRAQEEEKRAKDKAIMEEKELVEEKDKIDLEEKMKPFDQQRKFLVLKFFMEHFLKMAEKSNEFRHSGQSYLYVQMSDILYKRIEVCWISAVIIGWGMSVLSFKFGEWCVH